ncbi:hypothetical protein DFJ73DRAFT_262151, partial [Zopfochytrium polystomum]
QAAHLPSFLPLLLDAPHSTLRTPHFSPPLPFLPYPPAGPSAGSPRASGLKLGISVAPASAAINPLPTGSSSILAGLANLRPAACSLSGRIGCRRTHCTAACRQTGWSPTALPHRRGNRNPFALWISSMPLRALIGCWQQHRPAERASPPWQMPSLISQRLSPI